MLATYGITQVEVVRRAVIGILSTGDELVDAHEVPPAGKIRDSNRPMLAAAVREAGGIPLDLGIAVDKNNLLEETILAALSRVDLLVTSGGVSMGSLDLVKPLLERLGTVHFGRLLMKPGKPTTFATVDHASGRKLVFALPGNPASALTTFHLLVVPALWKLSGRQSCSYPSIQVTLAHPVTLDPERPEYHRSSLAYDSNSHTFYSVTTGSQSSSRLLSMRSATCLVEVPQGSGRLEAGHTLPAAVLSSRVIPFDASQHVSSVAPATGCGHRHHHHHHHQQHHSTESKQFLPPASQQSATQDAGQRFRVAVLTVSDRVSAGTAQDRSGPAIVKYLSTRSRDYDVVTTRIVPDEIDAIQQALREWADPDSSNMVQLILTTGGTGFAPRDITPEATRPLLHREAPSLIHAILNDSLKIVPTAMLSRAVAGIRYNTLIINMPGSPKAVVENLDTLLPVLPHALKLLNSVPDFH
eukprot:TRINITY_DN1947_c0_g1_i5.p1 TRINITY_DN1947_c0_g1~~TRINITY_DN1947_c0_g1_i5.p1  ORF type:complete len:470 (-),score=108.58 TRINITY_DN1947_c0_g1_i5:16-1425(-)